MKHNSNYLLLFFILLVAVLLSLNPTFFERKLFFNEFLSLFGILCMLKSSYFFKHQSNFKLYFLWYLIALVFLYSYSFFIQTNTHAYLRHSSIVYSTFCFFAGFFCFNFTREISKFLREKYKFLVYFFVFIIGFVQRIFMLPALSFFSTSNRGEFGSYVRLSFVFLLVAVAHGGSSSIFALIVLGIILIFRSYIYFRNTVAFFAILLICVFFTMFDNLMAYVNFRSSPSTVGGLVQVVSEFDPNLLTRFTLWALGLNAWLSNPIFGIGFGTELFSRTQLPVSFSDSNKTAMLPYFLGTHNSLITMLGRGGLILAIPLILMPLDLIKQFYRYRKKLNNVEYTVFISYFTCISVALLNVVIESPIHSGIFWLLTGGAYRVVFNKTHNT